MVEPQREACIQREVTHKQQLTYAPDAHSETKRLMQERDTQHHAEGARKWQAPDTTPRHQTENHLPQRQAQRHGSPGEHNGTLRHAKTEGSARGQRGEETMLRTAGHVRKSAPHGTVRRRMCQACGKGSPKGRAHESAPHRLHAEARSGRGIRAIATAPRVPTHARNRMGRARWGGCTDRASRS